MRCTFFAALTLALVTANAVGQVFSIDGSGNVTSNGSVTTLSGGIINSSGTAAGTSFPVGRERSGCTSLQHNRDIRAHVGASDDPVRSCPPVGNPVHVVVVGDVGRPIVG